MAAVAGLFIWAALALVAIVFILSLTLWLILMLAASLIRSLLTGQPPAAMALWQRWRHMTRQRWPQPASRKTPRTGAASTTQPVQDVDWREVPPPSTATDNQKNRP
jgi:hypothetical protein